MILVIKILTTIFLVLSVVFDMLDNKKLTKRSFLFYLLVVILGLLVWIL